MSEVSQKIVYEYKWNIYSTRRKQEIVREESESKIVSHVESRSMNDIIGDFSANLLEANARFNALYEKKTADILEFVVEARGYNQIAGKDASIIAFYQLLSKQELVRTTELIISPQHMDDFDVMVLHAQFRIKDAHKIEDKLILSMLRGKLSTPRLTP